MMTLALFALLAQAQFVVLTGAEFDAAVPETFSIEGRDLAIQKRNTVLLQTPSGSRAFLALVDGTGYSSDVAKQARYLGLVIAEGEGLKIAGRAIPEGHYSFSWPTPPAGEEGDGTFTLYDNAGKKLLQVATKRDAELKTPKPLQVIVGKNGTARFYAGRHSVELR